MQSLKQALKASQNDRRSLDRRLSSYLLSYHSSSHTTTGVSPATLFLNRNLRTKFDLLKPSVESRVLEKQAAQKFCHDRHAKDRGWSVGESAIYGQDLIEYLPRLLRNPVQLHTLWKPERVNTGNVMQINLRSVCMCVNDDCSTVTGVNLVWLMEIWMQLAQLSCSSGPWYFQFRSWIRSS